MKHREVRIRHVDKDTGNPTSPPAHHTSLAPTHIFLTYTHINNNKTETIHLLEPYCSEFLIHAADNEGLQSGIDERLVERLAQWCSIPVTYAGGGRNLADLDLVARLSGGHVDLTIGSALDCFGGNGVKFDDCVEWNRRQQG